MTNFKIFRFHANRHMLSCKVVLYFDLNAIYSFFNEPYFKRAEPATHPSLAYAGGFVQFPIR